MSQAAPARQGSPAPAGRAAAETVGLIAWLLAAIGWVVWYWRGEGFGPLHLVTAAGLVLALALLARRGWVRLFGPVLLYEALRSARRFRFFLLRWLYAVGLLLLLLWVHSMWALSNRYDSVGEKNVYKQQAKLAEEYFYAFAVVQFAAVVLLTPAYVAGGIAEEKERKTLEFLLATDLRGREIVFGKLLARLGNLGLFVLAGLPVLSLMQFFGGIDPGLLLASFLGTALTAASLGALGTLLSVQRRRARDAIILTYLAAAGYAAVASLLLAVPPLLAEYRSAQGRQSVRVRGGPPPPVQAEPIDEWVNEGVAWLNAGNPFWVVGRIMWVFNGSGRGASLTSVADEITELTEHYAVFHVAFTAVCLTWAVVRLRPIALAQAGSAPRKKRRRLQLIRIPRPKLGHLPMLWKEVWIEGKLRFGWFGRILVALVVGLGFVPLFIIFYVLFWDDYYSARNYAMLWDRLGEGVNVWVRWLNAIISSLMLVGVAVRAAGAVGGERDRDTLVSLMTTPLTTAEIFWAKWAGALVSVRLFAVWLAVVWGIGLACGALGLMAIPMEAVAWFLPAAFLAGLGLYCSAACKTTLRATSWTIVATLFILGGHWVCMGMCCFMPLSAMNVRERQFEWIMQLEAGLTPPFVFGALPYRDIQDLGFRRESQFAALVTVAQGGWVFAALVAGHLAHEQFRRLTNRVDWSGWRPRPRPRVAVERLPEVLPADEDGPP